MTETEALEGGEISVSSAIAEIQAHDHQAKEENGKLWGMLCGLDEWEVVCPIHYGSVDSRKVMIFLGY